MKTITSKRIIMYNFCTLFNLHQTHVSSFIPSHIHNHNNKHRVLIQSDFPISHFTTANLQLSSSSSSISSKDETSTSSNSKTITKDGIYIVNQMAPPLPTLKNTYYLLRHGQSWGNVEAVISSARSLATSEKHGLTPLGYQQGKESAQMLLDLLSASSSSSSSTTTTTNTAMKEDTVVGDKKQKRVFFYSSPFARARQTAKACLDGIAELKDLVETLNLNVNDDIIIEDGIMERYFGRLDDEAIHTYAYVWPVDMFDVTHTAFDVESVAAVSTRLYETILKIDNSPLHNNHENNNDDDGDIIVLVSHADVLQILQVYAAGMSNVGMFSSYRFKNGEVREMARTLDSLPEPQPLQPPKPGT